MPILEVEVVSDPWLDPADLVADLAEAAGQALGAAPGATWVKLRFLPPSCYAESGGGPPAGVEPVFVSVLKASWPEGETRRAMVQALGAAVAHAVGRPPEQVHILLEPPAAGRMAFGGNLADPPR